MKRPWNPSRVKVGSANSATSPQGDPTTKKKKGILSMRGVIGGLFSGRLSTGLHIGTVRAGFTKNTRNFYLLWRAIIVLTLESSIMLGLVASLFGIFFWGTIIMDSMAILGVVWIRTLLFIR